MSLLAHHIKKDIRHVRWLLGLWALLVLAQFVLVGMGSRAEPDDLAAQFAYQAITMMLPFLQAVLLIVIIPVLIHDEPLVGTTAFWYTRPISRSFLLWSKTLFIGIALIIFPAVVELTVMAANKVPLHDLVGIAPEILYGSLQVIVPVFALAALTLNFARFAITGVALYIGLSVLYLAIYLLGLYFRGVEETAVQSQTLALSRSMVSGGVIIVTGAMVVAVQYLTRRTGVSYALVGLGVIGMMLVGSYWPVDFMKLPQEAPPQNAVDCATLSIEVGDTSSRVSSSGRRRGREPEQIISAHMEITGLPPTLEGRITRVEGRFTIADKMVDAETNRSFSSYGSSRWAKRQIQALFPEMRVIGKDVTYYSSERILALPVSEYMEVMNTPGLLEGEADIAIMGLSAGHVFSLERGSRFKDGATEETIGEVRSVPGGALVALRRSSLNRHYARHPDNWNMYAAEVLQNAEIFYVLRNSSRGEVVIPDQDSNFGVGNIMGAIRRLSVKSLYLRFSTGAEDSDQAEPAFALDKEWLDGAELVRITRARIGNCTVSFNKENFSLSDSSRKRASRKHTHKHEREPEAEKETAE